MHIFVTGRWLRKQSRFGTWKARARPLKAGEGRVDRREKGRNGWVSESRSRYHPTGLPGLVKHHWCNIMSIWLHRGLNNRLRMRGLDTSATWCLAKSQCILRPLLFILYTVDLTQFVTSLGERIHQHADDVYSCKLHMPPIWCTRMCLRQRPMWCK